MLRYMAFCWDPAREGTRAAQRMIDTLERDRSDHWQRLVIAAGLVVLVTGADAGGGYCELSGDSGIILGTIFDRRACFDTQICWAKKALCVDEVERIARSSGQHLIESYWGSYIAILRNSQTRTTSILRGPLTDLPCLQTSVSGVHVIFSAVTDLASIGVPAHSIDWEYIAQYLLSRLVISDHTGLLGITEVRCGERVDLGVDHITKSFLWDPRRIARSDILENEDKAADLLRLHTKASVHAWASCFPSILHSLSGGLDSSIVLGCLRDAPCKPSIACATQHSPGSDGDERPFARLMANFAGCPLVELRRNSAIQLEDSLKADVSERPRSYFRRLELAKAELAISREFGAKAIFNGNRGDEAFYKALPSLAAADYLYDHGIGPKLFRTLTNAALQEDLSVWHVFRQAFHQGLVSRQWNAMKSLMEFHPLVDKDVIRSLQGHGFSLHPRFGSDTQIPPGKQFHLLGLTNPEPYYYPFSETDEPRRISPLVSQPVIELCLRIPTYVLTNSGWDRAIARRAFVSDVPNEILRRKSKGGMEEHVAEIFHRNLSFIRELLMDGALVKQGILNRQKLEQALSGRPSGILNGMVKLFHYVGIETWASIVHANPARAATV